MPRPFELHRLSLRAASGAGCLALVATLSTLGACGPVEEGRVASDEAPETAAAQADEADAAAPEAAQRWIDGVRVGRRVDAEGSVPSAEQAVEFVPGERMYVSMEVTNAPAFAAVHVVFRDPAGATVAEDEKKVPAEASHLYFDSGDTTSWEPGAYTVVVAVDGEPVAEQEITISGHPLEPKRRSG